MPPPAEQKIALRSELCTVVNPGPSCAQKRAQGLYISEKLDLLILYLLVNPFQALYGRVFKREARPRSLALSALATFLNFRIAATVSVLFGHSEGLLRDC